MTARPAIILLVRSTLEGVSKTTNRRRALPSISVTLVVAVVGLAVAAGSFVALRPKVGVASGLEAHELGDRVLVIVPHPDDETLGAGGTIHALARSGVQVRVVIVTAGDAYRRAAQHLKKGRLDAAVYRDLGDVRHDEVLHAASKLGLSPSDVICLGFADGSTNTLWNHAWDEGHLHVGRNGARHVPYSWAYRPGEPLCGEELSSDLVQIVKDFRPTTVIGPDADETHHDHWATAAFVTYALDEAGYEGRRLTFVVHFPAYPAPLLRLPKSTLTTPGGLAGIGLTWHELALDPADESAKEAAIDTYRSQCAMPDLALFMRAFVRKDELFASRETPRLTAAESDAIPSAGETGTVSVMPRGLRFPGLDLLSGGTEVTAVRMMRGPGTLWVGLRCAAPAAARGRFRLGLRLLGGGAAPQRIDLAIDRGRVTAGRVADDSLAPRHLSAHAQGDTMWVSLPVSVLDGRTMCLVGAAGGSENLTVWRDVRL